jgi:hypothetical protein
VTRQANANAPVDLQVSIDYDVLGNRVEEDVTQNGSTTVSRSAYDRGNAWADLNGNNQLQQRHLFVGALKSVFARVGADGSLAFYLQDQNNSCVT